MDMQRIAIRLTAALLQNPNCLGIVRNFGKIPTGTEIDLQDFFNVVEDMSINLLEENFYVEETPPEDEEQSEQSTEIVQDIEGNWYERSGDDRASQDV